MVRLLPMLSRVSCLQRSGAQGRATRPRMPREHSLAELHRAALGEQFTAMRQDAETTKSDGCRYSTNGAKLSGPTFFEL
jgi:hypothetical protein